MKVCEIILREIERLFILNIFYSRTTLFTILFKIFEIILFSFLNLNKFILIHIIVRLFNIFKLFDHKLAIMRHSLQKDWLILKIEILLKIQSILDIFLQ